MDDQPGQGTVGGNTYTARDAPPRGMGNGAWQASSPSQRGRCTLDRGGTARTPPGTRCRIPVSDGGCTRLLPARQYGFGRRAAYTHPPMDGRCRTPHHPCLTPQPGGKACLHTPYRCRWIPSACSSGLSKAISRVFCALGRESGPKIGSKGIAHGLRRPTGCIHMRWYYPLVPPKEAVRPFSWGPGPVSFSP